MCIRDSGGSDGGLGGGEGEGDGDGGSVGGGYWSNPVSQYIRGDAIDKALKESNLKILMEMEARGGRASEIASRNFRKVQVFGKETAAGHAEVLINVYGEFCGSVAGGINPSFATNAIGAGGKVCAPVSGITGKLTREASDQLRENARSIWQGLTGRRAIWDNLEVHHRIPLEWSHIFGKADPNRIANLVGINGKVHTQVSNAWAAWKQSLGGRIPTQAEVMEQALKIDELFKNHWVFSK